MLDPVFLFAQLVNFGYNAAILQPVFSSKQQEERSSHKFIVYEVPQSRLDYIKLFLEFSKGY